MTKAELVEALSRKINLPKKGLKTVVEEAISIICEALVSDEIVYLVGLGTLEVYVRKGITRRHPVTGKAVKVGDTIAVSFRAASGLKRKLNNNSNG